MQISNGYTQEIQDCQGLSVLDCDLKKQIGDCALSLLGCILP